MIARNCCLKIWPLYTNRLLYSATVCAETSVTNLEPVASQHTLVMLENSFACKSVAFAPVLVTEPCAFVHSFTYNILYCFLYAATSPVASNDFSGDTLYNNSPV